MIECIFTLDYEIYGNGQGSLRDVVLDPTQRLAEVFQEFDAPFVVFAEAVEFARMEEAQSDPDTAGVRAQLRELRAAGHEIALHLHPWWARARHEDGRWLLDWSERNICALHPERVAALIATSPVTGGLSEAAKAWLNQRAQIVERDGMRAIADISLLRSYPERLRQDPEGFAQYRLRFLANDPRAERLVKIAGIVAADCRVELLPGCCFHGAFLER